MTNCNRYSERGKIGIEIVCFICKVSLEIRKATSGVNVKVVQVCCGQNLPGC